LDFSDQSLQEAKNALNGFYDLFNRLKEPSGTKRKGDKPLSQAVERLNVVFRQAMDDDFNTPVAIAELQKFRGEVNRLLKIGLSHAVCNEAREFFRSRGWVLGLFQLDKWQFNPVIKQRRAEALGVGIDDKRGQVVSIPTDTDIQITPSIGSLVLSGQVVSTLTDTDIQKKVDERNEARRRKDFKLADEIRNSLASQGITVEDRPDGTSRWKR
jgi:cysteinyl-tRNA synthetase